MKMKQRAGRAVLVLLAGVCSLFFIGAPAEAQPAGREEGGRPQLRRASLGYSLSVRDNRWAPVHLMVENPGPETTVTVRGYFSETGVGRLPMTTDLELDLPAGGSRYHTMFVRAGLANLARFELLQDGNLVGGEDEGGVITLGPTMLSPRETFLVAMSHSDQNFSSRQELGDMAGYRFRFHNTAQVKDAPPRWQGYQAADALVVGTLPPEGVSYPQEEAIVNWVRAGGLLILCPGGYPDHYQGSLLEEISPVQVLGQRLIDDIPPLTERYGSPLPMPGERFGLTEVALRDGDVHLSMGDFPLVVSRSEGAGKVVFVAFDMGAEALTRWVGLQDFYLDLVGLRARWPRPADTTFPLRSAEYLDELVGAKVLPRWALGSFLTANIALVAVLIVLARKRREASFLILVAVAPVIAVGINFIGARASGIVENSLGGVHIAESFSGQDTAGCHSFYALLSPDSATTDIGFPDAPDAFPDALIFRILGEAGLTAADAQRQTYTLHDGDLKKLKDVIVHPRAPSLFQGSYLGRLPGAIHAEATLTSRGVRFHVKNESSVTLEEGSVAVNRNATSVPPLSPGAETTVELGADSARSMMAAYSRTAIRSRRQDIVNAAFAANRINDLANTGAAVFGWADIQPRDLEVAGLTSPPAPNNQTLWVTYADMKAEGPELLIPKGVASRRFMNRVAGVFDQGRWAEFSGRLDMDLSFGVPKAALGMEARRIDFWLKTERVPTRGAILAHNWETNEYDLVFGGGVPEAEAVEFDPAGRVELAPLERDQFSLPNPQQYLSRHRGEVRLRLIVEPIEAIDAVAVGGATRRPAIEDIDIEIEGIRE